MPLDEARVRAALAAAFPALPVGRCRFVGEGWDSSVWSVDGVLLCRFPKRPAVARALEREIALLPLLAPAGSPTDPALPFVGYPPIPGLPLDTAPGWPEVAPPILAALGTAGQPSCGRCTTSRSRAPSWRAWRSVGGPRGAT